VTFIGSLWSLHAYVTSIASGTGRSYLATARLALADAPAGTVIVSSPAPSAALGGFFIAASAAQTSQVMAPLLAHRAAPAFVTRPDGTFDNLMEFDGWGRLVQAAVVGTVSPPRAPGLSCWPQYLGSVVVPLDGMPSGPSEMRIGYLGWTSGQVQVSYAGQTRSYHVYKGLHSAFLPVSGSADSVTITSVNPKLVCIGDVEVGGLLPSTAGPAIPAQAVAG
jgi:hypothetical protein